MTEYIIGENEQLEEQPEGVVEIVEEPEELLPVKTKKDELAYLFEVPHKEDNDMAFDDLVSITEEDVFGEGGEDMSDLTEVTNEDIMGAETMYTPSPKPTRRVIRKIRRTSKPYQPPTSLQGIR